jgi:hypothetical protein
MARNVKLIHHSITTIEAESIELIATSAPKCSIISSEDKAILVQAWRVP